VGQNQGFVLCDSTRYEDDCPSTVTTDLIHLFINTDDGLLASPALIDANVYDFEFRNTTQ